MERKLKPRILEELRKGIQAKSVISNQRFYIEAPTIEAHINHPVDETVCVENPLHPELIAKISEYVKSGKF